ncbi:MAG TPA: hypothetical protein VK099_02785 [Alcanivoracaceae bacterium]|nr:hypothetical protein [Alcanivoracaceae bacterium]
MQHDPMLAHSMGAGGFFWMLIIAIILVVPLWRICQRTGHPGWFALFALLPLLNVALLYFLAFSKWPSQKENSQQ